ncbi:MAG: sigma-70 family RNA polymerase sigma factor [Planctomycetota bacterium]|nr:MAG: sigma-70 family RNA polymerase sigma factor [Planctomycetota bacterium]
MTTRPEDLAFLRYREEGDPEAMAQVFDAVAPKLLLVAAHLTRDAGAAEDLVQTTFVDAIKGAGRYDARQPLVPWMLGILSHRALDQRRRRRVHALGELEDVAIALDPLDLAADAEIREAIAGALDELPEPYREVLILRLAHGLEPTAIAHTLGRSPGTVRMQQKRGLEKLRRALPRGVQLPAFLFSEMGRGLGSVREAVLAEGAIVSATASTSVTGIGGWLSMKTTMTFGAILIGVIFIAWAWLGSLGDSPTDSRAAHATVVGLDDTSATLTAPESPATADPETRRQVAQRRTAGLTVRVTFAEDGSPARNVGVYVRPTSERVLGVEARTDDEGVARFDALDRGGYTIDLDRWREDPLAVSLWTERTVELAIPIGLEVDGTVVDRAGNAVGVAEVFRVNTRHHDFLQWVATTDSAGRFGLRGVAPETVLIARAPGYQPSGSASKGRFRPVQGTPGSRQAITLVLGARGNRLSGRVVDERGHPVPHALVSIAVDEDAREDGRSSFERYRSKDRPRAPDLETFAVRADERGYYATDEVPMGTVVVFARALAEDGRAGILLAEIAAGDNLLDIVLAPGAVVAGELRDDSGEPIGDVEVEAEWSGSLELGQTEDEFGDLLSDVRTRTRADGGFELAALLPGAQNLIVRLPGGDEVLRERVTLAAGEILRWDPVIERHAEVSVMVLDPLGEPLAGWSLGLCDRPGTLDRGSRDGGEGFRPNATDSSGRYRFEDVRLRAHVLTVHPPVDASFDAPYPTSKIPPPLAWRTGVLPSADELVIRLRPEELPTAGLHGRVLGPDGDVPARGTVRLVVAPEAYADDGFNRIGAVGLDGDGAFDFARIAPGTYPIVFTARDYPSGTLGTFTVGLGATLDVGVLTLAAPAHLELELRAADGGSIGDPKATLSPLGESGRLRREYLRRPDARHVFESFPIPAGTYVLVAYSGDHDFAPERSLIQLEEGEQAHVSIALERGKEQVFEIRLPPHPTFDEPRVKVDLDLYDADGHMLFWRREDYEPVDTNLIRASLRLAPGAYFVRITEHRDPRLRDPRPFAVVEFEVPTIGEPDPILVDIP